MAGQEKWTILTPKQLPSHRPQQTFYGRSIPTRTEQEEQRLKPILDVTTLCSTNILKFTFPPPRQWVAQMFLRQFIPRYTGEFSGSFYPSVSIWVACWRNITSVVFIVHGAPDENIKE